MEEILKVKNLSIQIKDRTLIQNISFAVKNGEAILLSGANGVGKSTLLKSILCLETDGKRISGEVVDHKFGNIFALNRTQIQQYRSTVAYIQQKDEYAEMGAVQVKDIISDSYEASTGKSLSFSEVNDLIDEWLPRRNDNSRVFDAKSRPSKFSGGEQRLLSVLSIVATRPKAELMVIDEPLNNLDFANARIISNLINKVIHENSKMGLLMISHCRIFPFITRELKLTNTGIFDISEHYVCHSCFGEPDQYGFY